MSSHSRALLLAVLAAGCAVYDPPPEATLIQPEGGAFTEGESVRIEFSESVDPDSIRIQLWPNERDIENEIAAGTEPVVEPCLATTTCGELGVALNNAGDALTLTFGEELGKPGRPYIIELLPGAADLEGNTTGASRYWDMQFKANVEENIEPIEFDDGVYIVLAQVDDPIPAVLTLISEIRVLEDGRFALAGAEGDEINGAPKNTREPENLIVDETDQGWTGYASGFVTLTEDNKRLLETDPFDLVLPVGPLEVHMDSVRLFAEIVKNPDTGMDRLDGTLSFEGLTLVNGANMSEQPGGSTALIADIVPEDVIPAGHPLLCEDLCGAVIDGLCEPPPDFPDPDFCVDTE